MSDRPEDKIKPLGFDEPDFSKPEPVLIPKDKKVANVRRVRLIIGWIFFIILLASFSYIIIRWVRFAQTQSKITGLAESESEADRITTPQKSPKQRRIRKDKLKYNLTEIESAINQISQDIRAVYDFWEKAHSSVPYGSLTKEEVRKTLDRLLTAFVLLDSADLKLSHAASISKQIRNASNQPGDKASKLNTLYVAIEKLISFIREDSNYERGYFEATRASLQAWLEGNSNEYEVKQNVAFYYSQKLTGRKDLQKKRIEEMYQAAAAILR